MLTALRLPSFHRHWPTLAECADKEGWPAARFLAALAEVELAERETRRIQRHLAQSCLPGGKTLATFDFKALPAVPRARIEALAAGDWIETGANLIAIGNSGAGKTHLLCAIGHALVETGRRRSTPAPPIWCRGFRPPAGIPRPRSGARQARSLRPDHPRRHRLRSEGPGRDLRAFELIARRYETRSLAIAANQPFSAGHRIFPDKAVTVAAIDRLVHHATILEMNVDSYRRRAAADRVAISTGSQTTTNRRQPRRQPRSLRQRQPRRQNEGERHRLNHHRSDQNRPTWLSHADIKVDVSTCQRQPGDLEPRRGKQNIAGPWRIHRPSARGKAARGRAAP